MKLKYNTHIIIRIITRIHQKNQNLIKDSFKDFALNRYGCLDEFSSMFLNHNLTIDFFFFESN